MKFKFLFILAVCFISCDHENEDEVARMQSIDSIEKMRSQTTFANPHSPSAETVKPNEASKPLLIARGSEPGWYAEFFKDHLNLTIDYGKKTLVINHDFSTILLNEKSVTNINFTNSENGKVIEYKIEINIETKSCTEEASGEKRERSIKIKLNDQLMIGCATNNF